MALINETMTAEEYRKLVSGDVSKPQPGNRKIMGATKTEWNGIKFDSQLELIAYQLLTESHIKFEFKKKFVVVSGFRYNGIKIQDITWTPDFYFSDIGVIVDTKGYSNETAPIKIKLFKRYLFDNSLNWNVWIIKKKSDIHTAIYLVKKRIENQPNIESEKFFIA